MTTQARYKELAIEGIMAKLKPNAYFDEHRHWDKLLKGFAKMSGEQLGILGTLMTTVRKEKKPSEVNITIEQVKPKQWRYFLNNDCIAVISHYPFMAYREYQVTYFGEFFNKYCHKKTMSYNSFQSAYNGITKIVLKSKEFTELQD